MNRRSLLGGLGTAAALGVAGCLNLGPVRTRTENRTVDAADVDAIVVRTDVGDVELTGTDGTAVTVEAELRTRRSERALDRIDVRTDVAEGVLTVAAEADTGFVFSGGTSVDFRIGVPTGGDAGVAVEAVTTGVGDVTASGVGGDLRVETGTGDVEVDGLEGYLDARTDVGEVTARAVTGLDRVRTDVGDVDVECPAMRTDVTVRADVGDVQIRAPSTLDATLDLATEVGEVRTAGLQVSVTQSGRRRLTGTLGSGGDTLRIRANVGDVTLRAL